MKSATEKLIEEMAKVPLCPRGEHRMEAGNVVERGDRPGKVRCRRCRADDRLRERHGEDRYVPGVYQRIDGGPRRPKLRHQVLMLPDWPPAARNRYGRDG